MCRIQFIVAQMALRSKENRRENSVQTFQNASFLSIGSFFRREMHEKGSRIGGEMEEYHTGPIKMTIFIVDYHLPDHSGN